MIGKPFRWVIASIRHKGLTQTGKIAASVFVDLLFDWRYGTDTIRWVHRTKIDTASANKNRSAPYQATKARPLLRLLRELDVPKESVFVDVGSGKGRVLLIASQYGFRKVVGIEFSGPLCEVARRNIEIFQKRVPQQYPIEVIEADATQYQFEPEHRVIYMYNPFDAYVLAQVIENLDRSLRSHPRKIWLIYNTPLHHEVVKGSGIFKCDSYVERGGTVFRIYET